MVGILTMILMVVTIVVAGAVIKDRINIDYKLSNDGMINQCVDVVKELDADVGLCGEIITHFHGT